MTAKPLNKETAKAIVEYLDNAFRQTLDTRTRVKALWEATGEISSEDAWAVKMTRIQGQAAYAAMVVIQEYGPGFDAIKAGLEAERDKALSLSPEMESLITAKVFNNVLGFME